MSTFQYPAGDPFGVAQFECELRPNVEVVPNSFNGSVDTIEMLGDRWIFILTYGEQYMMDRRKLAAFWHRVRYAVNRVQIWDFSLEQPLGTMRGTPTLKYQLLRGWQELDIAAPQGATLLAGDPIEVGGLYMQVGEDAVADANGTLHVYTTHPARATVAAGAQVNWNRPRATCMLTAPVKVPYQRGTCPGFSIELAEVW